MAQQPTIKVDGNKVHIMIELDEADARPSKSGKSDVLFSSGFVPLAYFGAKGAWQKARLSINVTR